ncbi:glycosyl hydrolase family 18 protein [Kitasatospora gansuensis]
MTDNNSAGPGQDLMSWGTPGRFDTIVLPITAIVGDQGELKEVIKRSAADLGRRADEVTPVDAWGAVSSYRNVGFDSWAGTDDSKELFTQARAQGLLGGVRKLITERDPALKVALAVGAWKTSEAFHELAKSPARRATFIDSLADIVKRFPMITAVVLDWEYPGRPGRGNPHGPQDAANYALLIRELKQKLPAVRISVTLGASVETLEAANVPALVAAGADQLHLMAYDYFGTPWSKALGHTANLRVTESAENSVDAAVSFPWIRESPPARSTGRQHDQQQRPQRTDHQLVPAARHLHPGRRHDGRHLRVGADRVVRHPHQPPRSRIPGRPQRFRPLHRPAGRRRLPLQPPEPGLHLPGHTPHGAGQGPVRGRAPTRRPVHRRGGRRQRPPLERRPRRPRRQGDRSGHRHGALLLHRRNHRP